MSPFREATDGEHWSGILSWQLNGEMEDSRDGGKHELVDAEYDRRDAFTADGRCLEDAFESKVTWSEG